MSFFEKIIRSKLLRNSGIASVNQAILSAINFLISILLIKAASKTEYGYYAVAFPVSLFFISLQNAIVNTPLTVLLPSKKGDLKLRYVESLAYGQFIFILPLVGFALTIIFILWISGLDSMQSGIAAALFLSAIGLLSREYLRSYFYAEENSLKVLKIDALYAVFFLGITGLAYWQFSLGVASIFLMMGISSLVVFVLFTRKIKWKYNRQSIKESFGENWKFGKWALAGVIITHVQNYSYLYLIGLFLGSISVADISASRLLLMPLIFVKAGWEKILIPYGARLRENKQTEKFFRNQILISILFVIVILIYIVVLFFFSDFIKWILLSEKYANAFNYVGLWGIVFGLGFLSSNASLGLQVIKKFDTISKVSFFTMLLTVLCVYTLVPLYGIEGGLYSLIIGESSLAVILWFWFGKSIFNKREGKSSFNLKSKLSKSISGNDSV